MTEPPKPKEGDENCLICGRPKSKHSPEELLTCSRKMEEWKSLRKILQVGLELNEYLQTVNLNKKRKIDSNVSFYF